MRKRARDLLDAVSVEGPSQTIATDDPRGDETHYLVVVLRDDQLERIADAVVERLRDPVEPPTEQIPGAGQDGC